MPGVITFCPMLVKVNGVLCASCRGLPRTLGLKPVYRTYCLYCNACITPNPSTPKAPSKTYPPNCSLILFSTVVLQYPTTYLNFHT